jgi:resuscitation-promoting factor RpfB
MSGQSTPPPGWFPDPRDPSVVRFWNGREWTAQTAPAFPPAPTAPLPYAAAPTPGPWKRLRLRTKVVLVVGALVVVGLLVPDTDADTTAAPDRRESAQSSGGAEQAAADETDDPVVEEAPATEEPVEEVEPEILMPALRTQSIKDARKALRTAGLTTEVVKQPSWKPAGQVLKQDTKVGTTMTAGQVVTLVVAAPMPRVPGVGGRGPEAARAALDKAGFKVEISVKEVTSGTTNVVLSQTPQATVQAAPGSVVRLVVSKVVVPVQPLVSSCTPGYSPCLPPASDYDCAGGSGDGPKYTGPVQVTGPDPYDLDADGDGWACAS